MSVADKGKQVDWGQDAENILIWWFLLCGGSWAPNQISDLLSQPKDSCSDRTLEGTWALV